MLIGFGFAFSSSKIPVIQSEVSFHHHKDYKKISPIWHALHSNPHFHSTQYTCLFAKAKKKAHENNSEDDPSIQNTNTNPANNNDNKSTIKSQGTKDKNKKQKKKKDWLNLIDPYQAGKKLRQNLNSLSTLPGLPRSRSKQSIFYLDDRFLDPSDKNTKKASSSVTVDNQDISPSSSNNFQSLLENPIYEDYDFDDEDNAPEVLVVGATGEVGRKIVQRLLRDPMQRFRVRVLVRDLYSKTLNLLGSGVTYCQGDLQDLESLEYAVTDIDKIVFCAGAPRMDEVDWKIKFEDFVEENLEDLGNRDHNDSSGQVKSEINGLPNENSVRNSNSSKENYSLKMEANDIDWQNLKAVMDLRSRLAEQVDYIGMQNLLQAYQNVRFADYGTSQAAKRSLFKFQGRPEDFHVFALDDEDDDYDEFDTEKDITNNTLDWTNSYDNSGKENISVKKKKKRRGNLKAQCSWIKNKFGHGVFTGRVPVSLSKYSTTTTSVTSTALNTINHVGEGGQAAIVSGRLRSREDPDLGVDLSNGFAGLLCRLCADGGTYEAFIRTGDYESHGIEYVCEFETGKKVKSGNKSNNKFISVRLPFSKFQPRQRRANEIKANNPDTVKGNKFSFDGNDVRQIGFRFRSERNVPKMDDTSTTSKKKSGYRSRKSLLSFYLALSYIKVYRTQLEPEFIYISDARIPPVVRNDMVKHEARYIETEDLGSSSDVYRILDENKVKRGMKNSRLSRSDEETYFKYLGEQLIQNSGLRYVIYS